MSFSGTIASDYLKLADIPLTKRPSLVDFAATDFLSLRDSLIKYIKAVYPLEYTYYVESDLGMMFIELIAYMGSVMSMKADMLANENFFATAKQRSSIKKLLELIGVRMRGPLSAAANAKITFSKTPVATGEQQGGGGAGGTGTGTGTGGELTTGQFEIAQKDRVVNVTSPQDGGAVAYTLYKVVNGLVEPVASRQAAAFDGGFTDQGRPIILYGSESSNPVDNTVYENLVLQEGVLVFDSGFFGATDQGQKSIKLTQAPVIEGSVEIFIKGHHIKVPGEGGPGTGVEQDRPQEGVYTEVDNIYFASGSSDRIFEIVYDENFAATIVFGDGTVGISPRSNDKYNVLYRIGGGTRGNILPDFINASIVGETHQLNPNTGEVIKVDVAGTVTNTGPATGGANAETVEHAKKWAPLTFARQDRLVTLEDYEVYANTFISTFGTIGKAAAVTRKAYSSANIIDIYVLEKASDLQLQKSTPTFKTQLLAGINKKKMATDEIVVADGLIRTIDLVTTIYIDKEEENNQDLITGRVRDEVLNYMSIDNRTFGETLVIAELNRKIFEVTQVRYSEVDNLDANVIVDFNEIIQLNNLTINVSLVD